MVRLTIDGRAVEVPEGTTVLRAAEKAGIDIPTLCDHPELTPYGGCRLCMVEVEGVPALQTSCTLPATNGMVIYTNTPRIREARRLILSFLFGDRNHFCMYCQVSGGDCELQNAAYREEMTHWPLQPGWRPYPVDASHEDFVLDHNRCILCRRCVRACGELVGNFTLGVRDRGAQTMIIADLGVPLGESTCVSCGTCVQVCPTGALIDRFSAYRGRDAEIERTKTVCVGCSVGCGVELITRENHLMRIDGDWEAPVNDGVLCEVGRYQPLKDERARIVTPLVRKNGTLKAASWDEALDVVAERLKPLVGRNGDGVAAIASARLPAEVLYLFKRIFADAVGSGMVTSTGWNSAWASIVKSGRVSERGLDALKSADCVVVLGTDLVQDHQVAGFFVKRSLPQGTRLVVIDPADNALSEWAHYVLRPQPGTERDLLLGIMAAVVELAGEQSDRDLSEHSPELASQRTGVAADEIRRVARVVASSQKPVFVYGDGAASNGSAEIVEAMAQLVDLIEAPGEGYPALVAVCGQANGLAAAAYGLDRAFSVGGHQVAYLALGDEDPDQALVQPLEGVPFIVVQASHVSAATTMADVVLPVETWAEQEGHYLNLEGRLQEAHRGLTPPEGVWSNVRVLQSLAEKLGITLDDGWEQALRARVPIA